jgi:hypothetical protein
VLLLQHPALVLVFKQKLCLSLTRWLGRLASIFSLSFSGRWLVSSSLSEVWLILRFQRSALWFTSCPALELGFLCVGLLGACFFAAPPFSGARSEIYQLAPCCQCVMLVCWLFFNFVKSFDFGCCSLAQEMLFVDSYLPYFRQWLITRHCQPICLSNLCLLKVRIEISSLPLSSPPVHLEHTSPSVCVPFQFLVYYSGFFCGVGSISVSRGLCWFISGVAVGIPHAAYLLTCWSTRYLPSRFGTGVWRRGSSPVFSV